jgi:curved DNA-binding protein
LKYKDYYTILGLSRNAPADDIKKAYRKLAHQYHPDVSKDPQAEERFKDIAEAYNTLKDPEKRAAYDQLGQHAAGQEFRPPPDWREQYTQTGDGDVHFEDFDLGDLFAGLRGGQRSRADGPIPGEDYEVPVTVTLQQAYAGSEVSLNFVAPEYDANGILRRSEHAFVARIPPGASDGQRLRVPGRGGKGIRGGRNGDLYLEIHVQPHRLYRLSGHDLYVDLPLAPWEAVLGASVDVPTLAGTVQLKVPAGTRSGQKLRLSKRGLPRPKAGEPGDLFAVVQIVAPEEVSSEERGLYEELAKRSSWNPRKHLMQESQT